MDEKQLQELYPDSYGKEWGNDEELIIVDRPWQSEKNMLYFLNQKICERRLL